MRCGPRFDLQGLIGRGGMGEVYRAHDRVLDREVAVKLVDTLDPGGFVNLKAEFRRAAGVVHPNVVQLYDLFAEEGRAWFTMELVDGAPFDRALADLGPSFGVRSEGSVVRLVSAVVQIIQGLGALHEAGIIHRDVKPSNVLFTPTGRIVLLDFGVAVPIADIGPHEGAGTVAGTPAYMAPEMFDGEASPASDAYALGVMLFELLTGGFEADNDLGSDEQRARRLREVAAWVPDDLAEIIARLPAAVAEDRPSLAVVEEVARRLGAGPSAGSPGRASGTFVGREGPLGALRQAWTDAQEAMVVVDISAHSGFGKTEVLRRFSSMIAAAGALVLMGRCHPQESVPFRGVDDLLDRLGHHLDHLPAEEAARLAPADLSALIQIFPTFARVRAFEGLRGGSGSNGGASPTERAARRAAAFRALRELLDQLSATEDLLLCIDDFHLADGDSLTLLETVLATPAPRLMLVLASRTEDADSDAVAALRAGSLGQVIGGLRTLTLPPLTPEECREIATSTGADASEPRTVRLCEEAGGSPLFLRELLRATDPDTDALHDLEGLIATRASRLPDDERAVLTAACVAEQPTSVESVLRAAGFGPGARDVADRLVGRALLRVTATPQGRSLAPYHQRVGAAITARLPPAETMGWHGRLADALQSQGCDESERLLRHLDGAGRALEAGEQARRAAGEAEERLAFHRAAELHQLVLDRGWSAQPAETRRRLADSLANAGFAARSGSLYQEILTEPGLDPDERTAIRARAVAQDLRAGDMARGQREMLALLRELGAGIPASPALRVGWSLAFRLLVWARGTRFTPVAEADTPVRTRRALDLLFVGATTLTLVDHLLADAAGARMAWDALRAGEPRRVARALAYKAGADAFLLGLRGHAGALRLLEEARRIATEHGSLADRTYCLGVEGTVRWARGEWSAAAQAADAYLADGRSLFDVTPGSDSSMYSFLHSALAHTGDLGRLARQIPEHLKAFERSGDRLGRSGCLLGQPSLAWLMLDQPERLERESAMLLAEWGEKRFLTQHYHGLITFAHLHLYRGEPARALAVLDEAWPRLARSGILTIPIIASEMWFLRGRVAAATVRAGQQGQAVATLRAARRKVAGIAVPWQEPLSRLLDVAEAGSGDPRVELAAAHAHAAGLPHLAAATRWRLGDPAGVAWFVEQGAARPEQMAAALA